MRVPVSAGGRVVAGAGAPLPGAAPVVPLAPPPPGGALGLSLREMSDVIRDGREIVGNLASMKSDLMTLADVVKSIFPNLIPPPAARAQEPEWAPALPDEERARAREPRAAPPAEETDRGLVDEMRVACSRLQRERVLEVLPLGLASLQGEYPAAFDAMVAHEAEMMAFLNALTEDEVRKIAAEVVPRLPLAALRFAKPVLLRMGGDDEGADEAARALDAPARVPDVEPAPGPSARVRVVKAKKKARKKPAKKRGGGGGGGSK